MQELVVRQLVVILILTDLQVDNLQELVEQQEVFLLILIIRTLHISDLGNISKIL
jgi:hypothetical protein